MRSEQAFLDEYRLTHRNPVNVVVHTICVPAIFFASVGLLWTIPIGRWLGLGEGAAPWVNGATVVAVLLFLFYANLSLRALVEMAVVFAVCVFGVLALQAVGAPVLWLCAAIWIVAWIGQFYGHHVEGAKPAFLDDLVFLWIGPLFVLQELRLMRPQRK